MTSYFYGTLYPFQALEKKYEKTPKARQPNPDIADWWALYDYGLEAVKKWAIDYKHPYPGKPSFSS